VRRFPNAVDVTERFVIDQEYPSAAARPCAAWRSAHELAATGAKARKRTAEMRDRLTAQEAQIARLERLITFREDRPPPQL
jgi:hypothetical protein